MKSIKLMLITVLITLTVGISIGWLLFHQKSSQDDTKYEHEEMEASNSDTVWACAMHPQVRQDEPGNCPICSMELTPLKEASSAVDPNLIQMSHRSAKLANVQTSIISSQPTAVNEITLQGKIEIDERKISQIPVHFECRIEKLYINFTGERISKGQLLAEVYSPELIAAQEELLQALKYKEKNPPMYRSAKNKLKYLEIADSEIERIETTGKILTNIKLYAHHAGVVLKLNIAMGSHVKTGDILFEIARLNQLWVLFDAYEKDLEWIRRGSKIEFTVASLPGKTFKSVVTFIDPVIDPTTRVAKVRTEVNNASRLLKPEMFAYGTLNILLQAKQQKLMVPQSAVLWTGKESLVYLKKNEFEQPTFEYRKITIGLAFGNHYVVEEGLKIGDEVVTRGNFTIDAAAQLSGKISMMNPGGFAVNSMPGMDMSGMDMK